MCVRGLAIGCCDRRLVTVSGAGRREGSTRWALAGTVRSRGRSGAAATGVGGDGGEASAGRMPTV